MISLAEARSHVLDRVTPLSAVSTPVASLLGLTIAEGVRSPVDVPPFDNSAMDGFAVRSADTITASASLRIVGTIAAGSQLDPAPLQAGEAYRIMTGAPMPPGADTVAMVELCTVDEAIGTVTIVDEVPADRHIRRAGSDTTIGAQVLRPGVVVSPAVIGLLRTIGVEEVTVFPCPKVGVFSTGDELVASSAPLEKGQIYDSNRDALIASLVVEGFEAVDYGLVRDDRAAIESVILRAASECDAIVTSGGVSMGDYDFVKEVLADIGDMRWMQVAIKPAKPLAFGTVTANGREVPVFGLPGNPVSSLVSFEIFARPALRLMASNPNIERWLTNATLSGPVRRNDDGKVHFVRVHASEPDESGVVWAKPASGQSSHQISSMALCNGLAVLPPSQPSGQGDHVDVLLLPTGA